jgi:hypothetical protein
VLRALAAWEALACVLLLLLQSHSVAAAAAAAAADVAVAVAGVVAVAGDGGVVADAVLAVDTAVSVVPAADDGTARGGRDARGAGAWVLHRTCGRYAAQRNGSETPAERCDPAWTRRRIHDRCCRRVQ